MSNIEFLRDVLGAELFGQVEAKLKDSEIKLADLSKGEFVAKAKFDDRVNTLNATVKDLTEQITKRDTDLSELKTSLEKATKDSEGFAKTQEQLTKLQNEYVAKTAEFENKLKKQKYEHALKDKISGIKFSSESAKRAFFNDALAKDFKADESENLLGFNEFVEGYKKTDPSAFIEESEDKEKPKLITGGKGGKEKETGKYTFPVLM